MLCDLWLFKAWRYVDGLCRPTRSCEHLRRHQVSHVEQVCWLFERLQRSWLRAAAHQQSHKAARMFVVRVRCQWHIATGAMSSQCAHSAVQHYHLTTLLLLLLLLRVCCPARRFVQDAAEGSYDIIIVDSSDPVGPAEVLYQQVKRRSEFKRSYQGLGSRAWSSHCIVLLQ
jgi:hypothetical protein